jgi:hypothetical protein
VNLGAITTAAGATGQLSVVGSNLMVTWPAPLRALGVDDVVVAAVATNEEPPPPPPSCEPPPPPAP